MIHGHVHKYGDNVDTDVIIPARYCTAYKEEELAPHCLEDLDKDFVKKVRRGDIIIAGENFGCGSSRENAPIAIKGAGPVVLGGRPMPPRLIGVISLLAPALLAALVATLTFGKGPRTSTIPR